MEPIRIACVRYLNTAPLIEGLDKLADVSLVPTVPSRIADMVRRGEADVGLASIIDAAAGDLAVLSAGMIGSDGRTLTVRLFSDAPLDRVTRLHADADSHTSVVLARVLLARRFGVSPEVVEFRAGDAWPQTVLLIGDKVVNAHPPGTRYPHQLDLGEAWKEWTGMPFVYAAWVCRAGEERSPRIVTAAALLDRQARRNLQRLDWIVATRASAAGWPAPLAREYLGSLMRYRLGGPERAAADRFVAEASGLGLAPRDCPTWAEEPAPAY